MNTKKLFEFIAIRQYSYFNKFYKFESCFYKP